MENSDSNINLGAIIHRQMSKINIQGTIDNIKSKSNVYTPIIEAIVNAIDSIHATKRKDGQITIVLKREQTLPFDSALPNVRSVEIHDNGKGFTDVNRDSFDTLYSLTKKMDGGKGFGRFMFLKYFSDVRIDSRYGESDGKYYHRTFSFGKIDEIIVNEKKKEITKSSNSTIIYLDYLQKDKFLDKEIETIARKLLEKLLIFFINDKKSCPNIIIKEADNSKQLILNNYLTSSNEINLLSTKTFELTSTIDKQKQSFTVKIFKIFFSKSESKIILTGHNREVTEVALHTFIPEFEDEFFDEKQSGEKTSKRNYVIKTYVLGKYLNQNVSLEREEFDFPKDRPDHFYPFSKGEIETEAANITKDIFSTDVKVRSEKKKKRVHDYINNSAPWHKSYINDVDLTSFAYNASDEQIELQLQKYKFEKEQETKQQIQFLLHSTEDNDFDERLNKIISQVTDIGKSDLAHYVCNRKVVLQIFEELRKRNDSGKANLEKDVHSLIFPMNEDSTSINYEDHNLWLLDERLVFSEYIASDRKISREKDALGEPDLVIFDIKQAFRNGDNEFSNPLTIFEFKRPKRDQYSQEDDPVLQIGNYLEKIRSGKYEMPEGIETIKVNESTPVYAYIICDITDKIKEFARNHQLTSSADKEGYFGFHTGFRMYVEIISFKKLSKDALLRNKIFFKKLHVE